MQKTVIWQWVRYGLMVLSNWTHSNLHNFYESYRVLCFTLWYKMQAGLLDRNHPWVTGLSPHTGREIWPDNIIFASPRKESWSESPPPPDEVIVNYTGRFLAKMVERSTHADPELPQGPKRRMPHAINYLHGTVHFNGGFLLFNDFKDLIFHMTDPAFVQEMKRFVREQEREQIIVFRERPYNTEAYAWCVTFVRAHLPWYANGNGPTRPGVLWGSPSPYATINPINGSWIRDLEKLRLGQMESLVRPPIPREAYFADTYHGTREEANWVEKFHAWVIYCIIRARGFQGPLVFTWRKQIEPSRYEHYKAIGRKNWRAVQSVSNPFSRRRKPDS